MPTKLHVATWKRIIEAMVPNTTIESEGSSYDELMNNIFNKDQYFQVNNDIIFKIYLFYV
jgi:hypothetical protein